MDGYGLVQMATPDEVSMMEQAQEQEKQETAAKDAFASDLQSRFHGYREARREVEDEWLDALRAVKGEYNPDQVQVMDENKALSRVFVKITSTKVDAAYARIVDLLFQNNDSFWDIVPQPLADIPAALKQQIRSMAIDELLPYPLDPNVRNGLIEERVEELHRGMMAQAMKAADEAALKMRRQVKEYLNSADALTDIKATTNEMVVLGTGCLKVATLNIRNHEKWESEGDQWELNQQQIESDIDHASVFQMFPDPFSYDCGKPNDLFRRHVLTKHELRELSETPGFDGDMIETILMESPEGNHEPLDYERELRNINDRESHFVTNRRYDVLEYWGPVDSYQLKRYGIQQVEDQAEYQANIWVCNGRVIMARMNPLKPESIPYKFIPYKKVLHRFWGHGIPRLMDDSQDVMNATARALLDNAALTAGPMFQMDVSKLPKGVSLEEAKKIYPYRLWFYDGTQGNEGPMIQSINVNANQSELSAIFELFRRFADEETSLPSYTHGEQTQSLNKTASGMSMLMTAANVSLKAVVKNIDDYLTRPLIDSLYHFAMRWSDNEKAKRGDLNVVAMGSTALMAKEIQSERMMQAMQVTANPVYGPMVEHRYLLDEYLKSLDIDTDKALRPEEEMYDPSTLQPDPSDGSGSPGVTQPEQQSGLSHTGAVPGAQAGVPSGQTDQGIGRPRIAPPTGPYSGN